MTKNKKIGENYEMHHRKYINKVLNDFFEINTKPSKKEKQIISDKLDISYERVNIWFQNKRARCKKYMKKVYFIKYYVYHMSTNNKNKLILKKDEKNRQSFKQIQTFFNLNIEKNKYIGKKYILDDNSFNYLDEYDIYDEKMNEENYKKNINENFKNENQDSNKNQNSSLKFDSKSLPKKHVTRKKKIIFKKTIQIYPSCNSLIVPKFKINNDINSYDDNFKPGDVYLTKKKNYHFQESTFSNLKN